MIQVNKLSKSFGTQVIFEDVTFNVNQRARIGLVGRNGSGKSTLFKILTHSESPDAGTITVPKNYKLGSLKQVIEFTQATVLSECSQVLEGEKKFDSYRVEKILFGLGFTQEDLLKDPHSFSGGFQIRINLAKLLATEPNMLLLDEPTNYLDIPSLRWLKNFLANFDGEVLLITHDKSFMDSIITHTMGIYRKSLKLIEGKTDKFYEQIRLDDEIYEKTKQNIDKRKKEMEQFVERFKAKASKATQAQSKLKQLNKMQTLDDLEQETNLNFQFNYKDIASKNIMNLEGLTFGYEQNNILFKDISFNINKGDCIGIIGKNGKGKSTLLNCIANELTLMDGTVKPHPKVNMSHFGQTNIARLTNDLTVTQEVESAAPDLPISRIKQICATMMFSGDQADKKVSVLSGGEKSRVMLGKILAKPSNLLLLDEPTNHLDIYSVESLTHALKEFAGSTIIVTHSEDMLRQLANKLIIFRKDGAELFIGGYDEFLEKIGWDEEEIMTKKAKPKFSKKDLQRKRQEIILERSKKLNPIKSKIEKLEENIIKSEDLLTKANSDLIKASENSDSDKIQELAKEVSRLESLIEDDFEQLETLQNQHDDENEEFNERLESLEVSL